MKLGALLVSCLVAIVVMIAFPRDEWVLKNQISILRTGEFYRGYESFNTGNVSLALPKMREPLWELIAAIRAQDYEKANGLLKTHDPKDQHRFWEIAVRYASQFARKTAPWKSRAVTPVLARGAKGSKEELTLQRDRAFLSSCVDRIDQGGGSLFASLIRFGQAFDEKGQNAATPILRHIAQEIRSGNTRYLNYDNGFEVERERLREALEASEGYRGEHARAVEELSIMMPEIGLYTGAFTALNLDGDLELRKDLATIGSMMVKTSEIPVVCYVGQNIMLRSVLPEDAKSRFPKKEEAIAFGVDRDREFGTDRYFADTVRSSYIATYLGDAYEYQTWDRPFRVGAYVLAGGLAFLWIWVVAFALQRFAHRDGYRAAAPHLLTAGGWILTLIVLGSGLDSLGLLVLAHIGLALMIQSDRVARIGTGISLMLGLAFLVLIRDNPSMVLPLLVILAPIVIMAWRMPLEARLKWGRLVGWTVTLSCFLFVGFGPTTLVPGAIWLISIALTRKPEVLRGWGIAGVAFVGAAIAAMAVGWRINETIGTLGIVFGAIVAVFCGILAANGTRSRNLQALGIGAVLLTVSYGAAVGWTIRHDRQGEALRRSFETEADRLRLQSGIS